MRRLSQFLISACIVALSALQMNLFTSCSDDMPADSYYTFTGEMMSDYLKNNERFSMFARIVERANRNGLAFCTW